MADTDSFIDEVTEEVRRDKLYAQFRRYGWIGAVIIILIVGGAAWSEWRKASLTAEAQALGDAILSAYQENDLELRADALAEISSANPRAEAALNMIVAAELSQVGDSGQAVAYLDRLAENGEVPEIYRLIAGFKALLVQAGEADPATLRQGFSGFATPGNPLRLLAEEQIALLDVAAGETTAAQDRFQSILNDAEASNGLQQRAMQAIVALGGEPDVSGLTSGQN